MSVAPRLAEAEVCKGGLSGERQASAKKQVWRATDTARQRAYFGTDLPVSIRFSITFFEIARIHTGTAEADEETAQTSYDKLTQENAITKTTKQGDVKGKTNEVKQLEVALGNYKENKATTSKELDAVLTYLDKLKPQCETKVGLGRS